MMNVSEIIIRAYFVHDSALTVRTPLSRLQNPVFVLLDPLDFQEERSLTDTSYYCLLSYMMCNFAGLYDCKRLN